VYNLEVCTVTHPTNPEHNKAFSVFDRRCDEREVSLCVHGETVLQSKDLRPFMGLQNRLKAQLCPTEKKFNFERVHPVVFILMYLVY